MCKNIVQIKKLGRFFTNSKFAAVFLWAYCKRYGKNMKKSYVGNRIFYPKNGIRFSIQPTDKPNTSILYNNLDDFLQIWSFRSICELTVKGKGNTKQTIHGTSNKPIPNYIGFQFDLNCYATDLLWKKLTLK